MKGLKNIVLSFFFLLILGCNVFASVGASVSSGDTDLENSVSSLDAAVIYNHVHPIYLEIEGSDFTQTISFGHRMMSLLVLSNRIIPLNYDFRSTPFISIQVNFNSPVPIFIRGHSLRN
ncbi:MAG TPA: hypothetical protein VFC65_11870 [Prolixibacteraceae bacterium]|nr:hypothetical protein [Prolixibacteraceae bacterium]